MKLKFDFKTIRDRALGAIKGMPGQAGNALKSRQTQYGSHSFISILVVAAILVILNLIAKNAGLRWDTTKNQVYSLSKETIETIKKVKEPIKVYAFFEPGAEVEAMKLLKEYSSRNQNIKPEFIDLYSKGELAAQYGIRRPNTVVFVQGNKQEETLSPTEAEFTSILIRLQDQRKVNVVFWTGNGEKDPDAEDESGFSEVKNTLARMNYVVTKQDALKDPTVASDTGILVIAGPQTPYSSRQIEALNAYLGRGGRAFVMLDSLQDNRKIGIEDVLSKYGVNIKNGFAFDPALYISAPFNPAVVEYPRHTITESIERSVYGAPQEVRPGTVPGQASVETLMSTSPQSWLEVTPLKLGSSMPEKNTQSGDVEGPIPIGVAMKYTNPDKNDQAKQVRLVVIGDSEMGTNPVVVFHPENKLYSPGNIALVSNSVGWLAERETLNIVPKDRTQDTISLTNVQEKQIYYFVLFGMPGFVLLLGILVWRNRRKFKSS